MATAESRIGDGAAGGADGVEAFGWAASGREAVVVVSTGKVAGAFEVELFDEAVFEEVVFGEVGVDCVGIDEGVPLARRSAIIGIEGTKTSSAAGVGFAVELAVVFGALGVVATGTSSTGGAAFSVSGSVVVRCESGRRREPFTGACITGAFSEAASLAAVGTGAAAVVGLLAAGRIAGAAWPAPARDCIKMLDFGAA